MDMLLERIKQLCKEERTSISNIEKSLGFGQKSIYRWDTASPSIDKVKAVAEYFGVTIDYLVGLEPERESTDVAIENELESSMDEHSCELFDAIKILCKERNISISTVEQDLGFSNRSLYHWYKNRPSIDKVKAVADYFEVTVDYLLESGKDEQTFETYFKNHPKIKMLTDSFEELSPEEINRVVKIIEAFKEK